MVGGAIKTLLKACFFISYQGITCGIKTVGSSNQLPGLPSLSDVVNGLLPGLVSCPQTSSVHEIPPRNRNVDTIVMQNGGDYGHHSATQRMFLQRMEPSILASVKENAVIFDLGCADGINSVHLLKSIKMAANNFTMAFVDLPENDWGIVRKAVKSFVKEVYPRVNGAGKPAEMYNIPESSGSKALLIGESFFNQVAAPESVNVAFTSTALHYLSVDNAVDRTSRAALDWGNFLRARAKELVPGGKLHVTALASYEQGVMPGAVWGVITKVLKEAVFRGMMFEQDRLGWQWPAYARTEDEWRLPFMSRHFPNLEMESFKIELLESPYWLMSRGNPCEFASLYVPSVMAWMLPYLRKTLPAPVCELFSVRLRSEVEQNPKNFRPDLLQAVMTIRRRFKARPRPLHPPPTETSIGYTGNKTET